LDNNSDGDCTDSGDIIYGADVSVPDEYVDCDVRDSAINPGATEIAADGMDQDCDGLD
jgi:hypothetical protein